MFNYYHTYYETYNEGIIASNCLYVHALATMFLPFKLSIEIDWDLGWISSCVNFYSYENCKCTTTIERERDGYDISSFISVRF